MWQLIRDSTGEVLIEGTYLDCLGRFHSLSNFSYHNHKVYSHSTFTIKEI